MKAVKVVLAVVLAFSVLAALNVVSVYANESVSVSYQTENPPAAEDEEYKSPIAIEWGEFWEMLKEAGPGGVVLGIGVLLFVFFGEFTEVFGSGKVRALATVLTSTFFAGVKPGDVEAAVLAALTIAFSTLGHWLVNVAMGEIEKRSKKAGKAVADK